MVRQCISELNNYLCVPVTISGAEFTFFDNFPHASVHLHDVVVRSAHPETFGDDTLLIAHSVFLVFNPMKLLRKDYTISACHTQQGFLSLRTASNGKNNFDIFHPSSESDTLATSLRLSVNQFRLSQMACSFNSAKSKLSVDLFISSLNAKLRIDGAHQRLAIGVEGLINVLRQRDFIYAQRQHFDLAADVLRSGKGFEVRKGVLTIDRSRLNVMGTYDTELMDLNLSAKGNNVSLISVFAFASQFKWSFPPQLRIRGEVNAALTLKGTLRKSNALGIELQVNGEKLVCAYDNTKFSINRIEANFSNGEKCNLATSTLNVATCNLSDGKSSANVQFYLTNLARPSIYLRWDVHLFESALLPKAFESWGLQYAALNSNGEYVATFPALDSLLPRKAILPKLRLDADLLGLEATVAPNLKFTSTDIALTVLDYDISKGSLKTLVEGQPLEVSFSASNALRPLAGGGRWTVSATLDNCDLDRFSLIKGEGSDSIHRQQAKFKLWDYAKSIEGDVFINKSTWHREKLDSVQMRFSARPDEISVKIGNANFLGGSTRGLLTISQGADSASILSAELYERQLDLTQLFKGFGNFGQSVLRSENIRGKFSGKLALRVPLRGGAFAMDDIQAQMNVAVEDGALIDVQPLTYLSKFISLDELMNLRFATLYNAISIRNGRVIIPSMQINSSAISLFSSGEHHFNGRYVYRVKVGLGDILFNRLRTKKRSIEENAFSDSEEQAKVWLFLLIEGDASSAYVRYDSEALGAYIQERVNLEKASLQEAWNETHGASSGDSARRVERRKQKNTPVLWQDDPSAPPIPARDTVKVPAKPKVPAQPRPPIIWDE